MKRIFILILLFAAGCKEKYMAKVNTPALGFLVVEGLINAGGPTEIFLTRAAPLDHISTITEAGAEMEVQSSNGASYPLSEQSAGKYTAETIPVDPALQYRLHIRTRDGEEFLSDYVDVKISPPIDSVSWTAGSENVTINVSTHDPDNKSVYYEWKYEETWKYESSYISPFVVDSLGPDHYVIVTRPPDRYLPKICWITDSSTRYLLASTARLEQDVVDRFPVNIISYQGSNRLIQRYSILVRQTVLGKDEYEWKQKVQKNTEELGSIFDAQPSETGGNIHSVTNPTAQVVGFIGCGSVTEKRIFIARTDLPPVKINTGYQDCEINHYKLDLYDPRGDMYAQADKFAILAVMPDTIDIAPMECVDCRLHGGVANPPSFW